MNCWVRKSLEKRSTVRLRIYAGGRGRPLQSTFPLTLRMKFGHAKHCTKDTVLLRTGHATASFFILAICFPPATPFKSWTYCFGVGGGFSGATISTTYFVAGGSSLIDFSPSNSRPSNYFFVTKMIHNPLFSPWLLARR
jgi:hypothetical protein